jgi:hypothetical protein
MVVLYVQEGKINKIQQFNFSFFWLKNDENGAKTGMQTKLSS